jgi:hypothetical protein
VAEKHWEAYTVETELLKKILDGEIETSQTASKGDAIYRFIIKPNRQEFFVNIKNNLLVNSNNTNIQM